ncbi:MAG: DNA-binding protein [Desulfobacca sp.]|nr:DNA-binding protein [Desulfobacca sp.]
MKVKLGLVIMGCLILLAASAWAQLGRGPGDQGGGIHYGMMWAANSVTTVSGEVTAVEKYTPGRGGKLYGLRLIIKTEKETLPIILGPAWYIEQQDFAIAPQDRVEVKGSRLSIQGQPTILAAELKKSEKILKLRDGQGRPLWTNPR